jgi:hypothetical protein
VRPRGSSPNTTARGAVTLGLGLAMMLLATGCRACDADVTPATKDAKGPSTAACDRRTTERLGIPFVKVCPQDLGSAGATFEPFWIAAAPLGCSAGEHETLRCPNVVALEHPAVEESRAPRALHARLAAVIDPNVAQSVCYMRFAGRLPTREERARAEAAMGLASVMVVQAGALGDAAPAHFDFVTLSEWVTDAPCETPNAGKCAPAQFPSGPRAPIPWGSIATCDATPLAPDAGAVLLGVGESCPAAGFGWAQGGASTLPCAVRSVSARPAVLGFSLSCRAPPPGARHPDDDIATAAAFRCVVPEVAILTGPDASP